MVTTGLLIDIYSNVWAIFCLYTPCQKADTEPVLAGFIVVKGFPGAIAARLHIIHKLLIRKARYHGF